MPIKPERQVIKLAIKIIGPNQEVACPKLRPQAKAAINHPPTAMTIEIKSRFHFICLPFIESQPFSRSYPDRRRPE